MKIRQVQCDGCMRIEDLKYNGEHWLIPSTWVEMYCDHKVNLRLIYLYAKTFKLKPWTLFLLDEQQNRTVKEYVSICVEQQTPEARR